MRIFPVTKHYLKHDMERCCLIWASVHWRLLAVWDMRVIKLYIVMHMFPSSQKEMAAKRIAKFLEAQKSMRFIASLAASSSACVHGLLIVDPLRLACCIFALLLR